MRRPRASALKLRHARAAGADNGRGWASIMCVRAARSISVLRANGRRCVKGEHAVNRSTVLAKKVRIGTYTRARCS